MPLTQSDLQAYAVKVALQHDLPVDLFLALIDTESGWDPSARSKAGAIGLTQIMPSTAKGYGFDVERLKTDPYYSIEAGAKVLKAHIDVVAAHHPDYRGEKFAEAVLRTYNGGFKHTDYGAKPAPNKENTLYPSKVLGRAKMWAAKLPQGLRQEAIYGGGAISSPPPSMEQPQPRGLPPRITGEDLTALNPPTDWGPIRPTLGPRFITDPITAQMVGSDEPGREVTGQLQFQGYPVGPQPDEGILGDIGALFGGAWTGLKSSLTGLGDLPLAVGRAAGWTDARLEPPKPSFTERANPNSAATGRLLEGIAELAIPASKFKWLSKFGRLGEAADMAAIFGGHAFATTPGDLPERFSAGGHGAKTGGLLGLLGAPEGMPRWYNIAHEAAIAPVAFGTDKILPESPIPGVAQNMLFGAIFGAMKGGRERAEDIETKAKDSASGGLSLPRKGWGPGPESGLVTRERAPVRGFDELVDLAKAENREFDATPEEPAQPLLPGLKRTPPANWGIEEKVRRAYKYGKQELLPFPEEGIEVKGQPEPRQLDLFNEKGEISEDIKAEQPEIRFKKIEGSPTLFDTNQYKGEVKAERLKLRVLDTTESPKTLAKVREATTKAKKAQQRVKEGEKLFRRGEITEREMAQRRLALANARANEISAYRNHLKKLISLEKIRRADLQKVKDTFDGYVPEEYRHLEEPVKFPSYEDRLINGASSLTFDEAIEAMNKYAGPEKMWRGKARVRKNKLRRIKRAEEKTNREKVNEAIHEAEAGEDIEAFFARRAESFHNDGRSPSVDPSKPVTRTAHSAGPEAPPEVRNEVLNTAYERAELRDSIGEVKVKGEGEPVSEYERLKSKIAELIRRACE